MKPRKGKAQPMSTEQLATVTRRLRYALADAVGATQRNRVEVGERSVCKALANRLEAL